MRKIIFFLACLLLFNTSYSQKTKVRFPVGLFNKDSTIVIGINTGFASFGYVKNKTIGLHLELFGLGEMVVNGLDEGGIIDSAYYIDLRNSISPKEIYGINISGMGLFCRSCDVHGLSINGLFSMNTKMDGILIAGMGSNVEMMSGIQLSVLLNSAAVMKGLQISPGINDVSFNSKGIQAGIWNRSKNHTGIQIGIINRSEKLKGLQFGIWNISGKRKLPFINW